MMDVGDGYLVGFVWRMVLDLGGRRMVMHCEYDGNGVIDDADADACEHAAFETDRLVMLWLLTKLKGSASCVGHWPKFSSDNVRILASAAAKSSTTEAYQLVRNSTDSNKQIPILPPTPTNLIVQDRTGLARCLQFSKIPGEERLKLSVKMFESECIEQNFEQNLKFV